MLLGHRVRLIPTADQEAYFRRASGCARFAYNWALTEWQRQIKNGQKPSEAALRRALNAIKAQEFPWLTEVTKNAPQQAIKNLGRAYINFFEDLKKYERGEITRSRIRVPKLKKKGMHDAFRADNGTDKDNLDAVRANGKRVRLPRIGWVRMCEQVRFAGRILSVTISRTADRWYASFTIEVDYVPDNRTDQGVIGIDLGVAMLATLSNGLKVPAPKPLRTYLNKLRRLSRSHSRKRFGSRNRAKAKTKLARLHRRMADIRLDALHKLTTDLTRYATIVIEDLNVAGMVANKHLSLAIRDLGLHEFRRQLEYKSGLSNSTLVIADRWYPSSKLCSTCGIKNDFLRLGERIWKCASCGTLHDRDINAAINLARYPESWAGSACGAEGAGGEDKRRETSGVEAGRIAGVSSALFTTVDPGHYT
jgi:putative transposase